MGLRLEEIQDEFERAVFVAAYGSREQRLWRLVASTALAIKHAIRGMAFSWPLYLLAFGALFIPGGQSLVFILIFSCGIAVSGYILAMGVKEDYREYIDGMILKSGDIRRMLFSGV